MSHRSLAGSVRVRLLTASLGLAALAVTGFGAHVANAAVGSMLDRTQTTTTTQAKGGIAPAAAKKPAPPAKPTAAKLLTVARRQIGVKANAAGGGTKFQNWYAGSKRALETIKRDGGSRDGYRDAPWCGMFVSWVGDQAGARATVGWDAYTVTHAKWFKNNKRWGATPKPGAVVFFSWSGSKSIDSVVHVGFVEKVNGNGTITTIEGNTDGGKVERHIRPTSLVVGYGYPDYAS